VDAQIVNTLESFGPLSTSSLASKMGVGREAVFKRCKRLEKEGVLISQLERPAGKSLYFFPATREVMTSNTHAQINRLNDALLEVVRSYALPHERTQLVAALEFELQSLAETLSEAKRVAFEEFAQELIKAARTAEKRGDLTEHLGIRPMRPTSRIWRLGPQLRLLSN
jgi:predicted ArsR family transcriptional regulator